MQKNCKEGNFVIFKEKGQYQIFLKDKHNESHIRTAKSDNLFETINQLLKEKGVLEDIQFRKNLETKFGQMFAGMTDNETTYKQKKNEISEGQFILFKKENGYTFALKGRPGKGYHETEISSKKNIIETANQIIQARTERINLGKESDSLQFRYEENFKGITTNLEQYKGLKNRCRDGQFAILPIRSFLRVKKKKSLPLKYLIMKYKIC